MSTSRSSSAFSCSGLMPRGATTPRQFWSARRHAALLSVGTCLQWSRALARSGLDGDGARSLPASICGRNSETLETPIVVRRESSVAERLAAAGVRDVVDVRGVELSACATGPARICSAPPADPPAHATFLMLLHRRVEVTDVLDRRVLGYDDQLLLVDQLGDRRDLLQRVLRLVGRSPHRPSPARSPSAGWTGRRVDELAQPDRPARPGHVVDLGAPDRSAPAPLHRPRGRVPAAAGAAGAMIFSWRPPRASSAADPEWASSAGAVATTPTVASSATTSGARCRSRPVIPRRPGAAAARSCWGVSCWVTTRPPLPRGRPAAVADRQAGVKPVYTVMCSRGQRLEAWWTSRSTSSSSAAATPASAPPTPPPSAARRVLVLEKAPRPQAGGNSYYTAGAVRIAHGGLDDLAPLLDPDDRHGGHRRAALPAAEFAARHGRGDRGAQRPRADRRARRREPATRSAWLHGKGLRYRLMYERQAYADPTGRYLFWGGLRIGNVGGGEGADRAAHRGARRSAGRRGPVRRAR